VNAPGPAHPEENKTILKKSNSKRESRAQMIARRNSPRGGRGKGGAMAGGEGRGGHPYQTSTLKPNGVLKREEVL